MLKPANIYLKGPRTKINDIDYDEAKESNTVTINGVEMSIEEFRRNRPKSRKMFTGLRKKLYEK